MPNYTHMKILIAIFEFVAVLVFPKWATYFELKEQKKCCIAACVGFKLQIFAENIYTIDTAACTCQCQSGQSLII